MKIASYAAVSITKMVKLFHNPNPKKETKMYKKISTVENDLKNIIGNVNETSSLICELSIMTELGAKDTPKYEDYLTTMVILKLNSIICDIKLALPKIKRKLK